MGILDVIGSLVSSAVSVVSNMINKIGDVLVNAATKFLNIVGPYLGPALQIINAIATLLGVFKPGEDPEELGQKAMQADKKPEDFDTISEYIDYLRNEVELDKEKFKNATKEEKIARQAVGASIAIKGIEEKKGFDIPMETWVALAKLKLENINEADTILDTFKSDGLKDFSAYVNGKLHGEKLDDISSTLVEMYQKLEPELSKEQIEQKVLNMEVGDADQ